MKFSVRNIVAAAIVAVLFAGATGVAGAGEPSRSRQSGELALLPEACESSIAVAAAPEYLRDQAGVWVLGAEGYQRSRESANGFECIINRDHSRVLKPTCFDAEGAATIIPKIRRFGDGLLAGKSPAAIQTEIDAAFAAGDLRSPGRTGVAYMLSAFNRPYNGGTGTLGWFPPHMMIYAPGVTNDDIGSSWQRWSADSSLPVVGYEGPQGYIIVAAPDAKLGLPSAECPAWVTDGIPRPLS